LILFAQKETDMRSEDVLNLEDLSFDEAPDIVAAMTLPDLRRYVEEDHDDDDDLGLRTLLENPEALSRSFRRQLQ
jgi:hypothetical protein